MSQKQLNIRNMFKHKKPDLVGFLKSFFWKISEGITLVGKYLAVFFGSDLMYY